MSNQVAPVMFLSTLFSFFPYISIRKTFLRLSQTTYESAYHSLFTWDGLPLVEKCFSRLFSPGKTYPFFA